MSPLRLRSGAAPAVPRLMCSGAVASSDVGVKSGGGKCGVDKQREWFWKSCTNHRRDTRAHVTRVHVRKWSMGLNEAYRLFRGARLFLGQLYDSCSTPSITICQGNVRLEHGQRRTAGVDADGCTTIPGRIHTSFDRVHAP